MRHIVTAAAVLAVLASGAVSADNHVVTKKSVSSVSQTLDRLVEGLKQRSIPVVARVDHAAGARNVGQTLRNTELLIFGNPKLGTPLMQANRQIGLELPMKVLAWEDEGGQVWLSYTKPSHLMALYGIKGQDKVFGEMTGALDKLTDEATQAK